MGQRNWIGQRRRPLTVGCSHTRTVMTITAGLQRVACEDCGRVTIGYAGDGAVWRDIPAQAPQTQASEQSPTPAEPKPPRCATCGAVAIFLTPSGIACSTHAWEAATAQEFLGDGFWIPRLIDATRFRRLLNDLDSGEGSVVDLTWKDSDDPSGP